VLRSDGHLALVWNVHRWDRFYLRQQIDEVYAQYAPQILESSGWGYGGVVQRGIDEARSELDASPAITRLISFEAQHSATLSIDDYTQLLCTYSNHRILSNSQRESLLNGIAEVLSANGDTVIMDYETQVLLATV
jgi:hypothetical protein